MPKTAAKKISRRDAIKILTAAAGAATLANLPAQWSKPGFEMGVLPAHAQTSALLRTLAAEADKGPFGINICSPDNITSSVTISPAASSISMSYSIVASSEITIHSPALTGTAMTDATGVATIIINAETSGGGTIAVTWSFTNASDGTGSDTQTIEAGGC